MENLNLQKLPEVPDRDDACVKEKRHPPDRDDACVKEKRHPPDKGGKAFFLFQAVTSVLTTSLPTGVWAPRIRFWT